MNIAERFKLHQDLFMGVVLYAATKHGLDRAVFNAPCYDAFLCTVKAYGDRPFAEFRKLLYVRLKGACLDYLRAHHNMATRQAYDAGVRFQGEAVLAFPKWHPVYQGPGPGDAIDRKQREGMMKAAIMLLPERQRKIVDFLIAGMTQEDIGKVLGLSGPRISQILVIAVKQLKEHIAAKLIR